MVKNPPANAGDARDTGSIPRSGNGNPLQYSCLGKWVAVFPGVEIGDPLQYCFWEIPRTGEPGESPWGGKELGRTEHSAAEHKHAFWRTPVFLTCVRSLKG